MAAVAQIIHNVKFDSVLGARRTLPGRPTVANLADDFDAYFDNLATAATHGNKVVQGALTQTTQTASSQHAEVENLLGELKAALPSSGGRNSHGGGGGCNNLPTATARMR